MPVHEGITYHGSLWLKGGGFRGRVVVALEPDADAAKPYDEAVIGDIHGDWKRYEFALKADRSDPLARFVILFQGRGRLWVDQVSLMPGDAVDGVRRDVFERVEALHPGFVRWPGGNVAQDYHWLWGIGPRDRRVTWTNAAWARENEPSDFATDEYVRFCRNLKAEPTICVNVEGAGATAEEAAHWVEYCNGPASSRFGAMRAAAGHPEPFGVRWWEIGNEVFGDWVRGHSDAATYARNANRYIEAMRKVDPTIKVIAVGDNNQDWNRTVLREAGKNIDVLAIHHYYGAARCAATSTTSWPARCYYERFYRDLARLIRDEAPGRPITLAINEWGLSFPPRKLYSIDQALYAARLMNVFERSSPVVSDDARLRPGQRLVRRHHPGEPPRSVRLADVPRQPALRRAPGCGAARRRRSRALVFDSSREGKRIPYLDAVASRSRDGRHVFVKAVNTDHARPLSTTIKLVGAKVGPRAELAAITATSPGAFNSFATPDAVAIRRSIDRGRRDDDRDPSSPPRSR